jgi:GH43 family beta-xylosidase
MGPYIEKGKIADAENDIWAIDGTMLEHDQRRYFVWSGWPTAEAGFPQNLYLAEMENPWTLKSPRVLLAEPDQTWEQSHQPILEGPQILRRHGHVFIVYSADASWTPDYKLGLLHFRGGDLLQREAWEKHAEPVFQRGTSGAFGPGHACFITTPETSEDWIVYHTKNNPDHNWSRTSYAQTFSWDNRGWPIFGMPLATSAS